MQFFNIVLHARYHSSIACVFHFTWSVHHSNWATNAQASIQYAMNGWVVVFWETENGYQCFGIYKCTYFSSCVCWLGWWVVYTCPSGSSWNSAHGTHLHSLLQTYIKSTLKHRQQDYVLIRANIRKVCKGLPIITTSINWETNFPVCFADQNVRDVMKLLVHKIAPYEEYHNMINSIILFLNYFIYSFFHLSFIYIFADTYVLLHIIWSWFHIQFQSQLQSWLNVWKGLWRSQLH